MFFLGYSYCETSITNGITTPRAAKFMWNMSAIAKVVRAAVTVSSIHLHACDSLSFSYSSPAHTISKLLAHAGLALDPL